MKVRRARVEDAAAIAHVHIASSDDAYAPLAAVWPIADAERRAGLWRETLAEPDGPSPVFVAEDEGSVVGFARGGPARRNVPEMDVEIYVIHVLPAFRGRGIGGALWTAVCSTIRGPDLASMYVETVTELACCAFYEGHGGAGAYRRPMAFHGAPRTAVIYQWARGAPSDRARP
jgi:ribosomal protein S18 acetylase RimI-like enzyme